MNREYVVLAICLRSTFSAEPNQQVRKSFWKIKNSNCITFARDANKLKEGGIVISYMTNACLQTSLLCPFHFWLPPLEQIRERANSRHNCKGISSRWWKDMKVIVGFPFFLYAPSCLLNSLLPRCGCWSSVPRSSSSQPHFRLFPFNWNLDFEGFGCGLKEKDSDFPLTKF